MKRAQCLAGVSIFGLCSIVSVHTASAAACNSPYVTGDVFASVGNSTVNVYTPTGTLVCSLNDASGTTYTTGSAFDPSGNLYVTNFGTGTVSKFDNSGNLVSSNFFASGNTPESVVVVSVGPFAGSTFVGGPSSSHVINQYNTATGALIKSFSVAGGNGTGGTDWFDFITPTRIVYDGEGTNILSYDLSTSTQLPQFATAPNATTFAMRVIPSGTLAGELLAADSTHALLFSSTGTLLKTYTLPGNDGSDFALNLDPNGTDFWTAGSSGLVQEVNIATGTIDETWSTGSSSTFGLAVFGELSSVNPTTPTPTPTPTPEPASMTILGVGLAALAARSRHRAA